MKLSTIIQGCQNNDPQCERLLVEHFAAILFTVSRRYSRSREEAEDVLQDAFVKIFENIQKYQPERGSLEGWMRRIVIRTALRDYRRKFPPLEKIEVVKEQLSSSEISIIDKLEEEDLLAIIAQLPDGYRQVFNLYVIDGYSHKEVGKMLGLSESTSRSQLTRAKRLLRQKLVHYKNYNRWIKSTLAAAYALN